MILITGGAWQGKREYARELLFKRDQADREGCRLPMEESGSAIRVADGADCTDDQMKEAHIISNLHLWIRRLLEAEAADWPEEAPDQALMQVLEGLIKDNPQVIITVNELGCGVIPMEASERRYRECTGRIACRLAGKADRVYRVVCGIGSRLK